MTRTIDRSTFRQARERARDQGFVYRLPDASQATEGDFEVRIRRLSLQEQAATNGIPQSVQDEVYRRSRKLADWQAEQLKRKTRPSEMLDAVKNDEILIRSVNVVCCAAWIDPVLVETEAELATTSDAWHVDDFTIDDRWSAFQAITNGNSEESKSLRLFRPEPADDGADSGAMPVAAPTKRGAGAGTGGVDSGATT